MEKKMLQVLQNLRSGETRVVEIPIPTPNAGEALVRNAASLVSAGTERMLVSFAEKNMLGKARSRPDLVRQVLDKARREGAIPTMQAAINRLEQPMPLGYSSAGTIMALGDGMEGFRVGQRVACAGGGYAVHAEYVTIPRNLLTPLPDHVDFHSAAFTTLGAIALHGFRLAQVQLGECVAVIGLGLLGLLAAQIVRAAGCNVLGVDLDERRLDLGRSLGIQAVARPQAEEVGLSLSRGRGCDAVLICADTTTDDPVNLAGLLARDRARVVAVGAVGLNLPRKLYYEKEITFLNSRSYGPGRYDPNYEEGGQDYPLGYVRWTEGRNLEAVVEMLSNGQLHTQQLVSHTFPVEKAPAAYELITAKKGQPFLGVLLTYNQDLSVESEEVSSAAHGDRQITTASTPFEPIAVKPVDSLRLGVLGAGNFAVNVLLPAISHLPDIEKINIASTSGLSAQHAAQRFGFARMTSDENQVISDEQVNTLAILTRHHLHARQVIAALRAGKHVFCEKPLALNQDELLEIDQALAEAAVNGAAPMLMVGFNRRFSPFAQQLKTFLNGRTEPLFAHYRVNAGYIPLSHWLHDPKQGGGRLIGEGCHFIDFLTFLVGSPPQTVRAVGLPDAGRYREDNFNLVFTFEDGSIGNLNYLANGDKSFTKERVEVFCAGRVMALDDFRSLEMVQQGKRQVKHARLRQDKGHTAEWQAFSSALRAGGPPPIPYQHLFGVTRASFAAVQALRSGKTIQI